MNNLVEIIPISMTYGGDAIGRMEDGRAVFVPFGIPGERVLIELVKEKKTFLRGKINKILSPSPSRIEAKCAHFQTCGGCHYQHLSYESQLEIKQEIVNEQLTRLGGFADPRLMKIKGSPKPWNYRNSMQFHLSSKGKIGFRGVDPNEIIEIHECYLPLPALNRTWPLLDFELGINLDRIELREGVDEKLLLHLHSASSTIPAIQIDFPMSMVFEGPGTKQVIAGKNWIEIECGGRTFRVSAGSFFQVNSPIAEEMIDHLLENLKLAPNTTILDLYCGVGLFSEFLASQVQTCIGVENSPEACEDYIVNLDDYDDVHLYEGSVEDIIPFLEIKPNIVIADPPRSGIARQGLDTILKMQPGQIAYVSCDPATLARDLKYLSANGYSLTSVQPFDLFPQTFHIETISIMKRNEDS